MKKYKQIDNPKTEADFDMLIKQFFAEHGNICFAEYDGDIYIYKLLNRKAYKNLISNPNLSQIEKEDEVCKECILWPREFDPDEYDAGMPTYLYEQIMENSFLTGVKDMILLIETCREETDRLDSQMSCIISEAFPSYSIEEIEEWDMIKFCQMFTKAEWKLKNLRSLTFDTDMVDFLRTVDLEDDEPMSEPEEVQTHSSPVQTNSNMATQSNKIKVGNREMTADEYRQYLEFQKQFPDIDWGADAMFTGYETQTISTIPTPLRIK